MDVGTGLAILGLGLPAAVALLIPVVKLMPVRKHTEWTCPVREHEARMCKTEMSVARLQENIDSITATLLRIERKLEIRNGRDERPQHTPGGAT